MTDLEMVRRCAEKMGYCGPLAKRDLVIYIGDKEPILYDPLHDDAQAMALVKKFRLMVWTETVYWLVADSECEDRFRTMNKDLNRAIVECVARMP